MNIKCKPFKKEIPERICLIQRTHAKLLAYRGESRAWLRACCDCETGQEIEKKFENLKEEQEEMDKRKLVVCKKCGQEKLNQGQGLCSPCYYKMRREGTLPVLGRGNWANRSAQTGIKILGYETTLPESEKKEPQGETIPGKLETKMPRTETTILEADSPAERWMTLDFNDYPEIQKKLASMAHYDMRSLPAQAMWILREYLTAEGKAA